MISESIHPIGEVERIVEFANGSKEIISFKNTILKLGRIALANALGHNLGPDYLFYINEMIWGSNGTTGGAPKFVNSERTGLFGPTALSKPVVSTVDSTRVIFTSVIPFNSGIEPVTLNEMALVMASRELYSMVTFPDLTKTSSMQITWNWSISII
jgi:hypothetical protein